MLSKRCAYDGRPVLKGLKQTQIEARAEVERKIRENHYVFEQVACCLCGGEDFVALADKDRYGLAVKTVICTQCGLCQTNPRMTQSSYNEFYDQEYRRLYTGSVRPPDWFFNVQYNKGHRIYHYLRSCVGDELTDRRVLEVGCGAGGILHYFREKGNRVLGVDLGSEYLSYGVEKYGLDLRLGDLGSVSGMRFDIVIYCHVLEHILDPISEVMTLRSALEQDALVYVEVPGLLDVHRAYGDFMRFVQNAHVYHYCLSTLCGAMSKGGMELVQGNERIWSLFRPGVNSWSATRTDYEKTVRYLEWLERNRLITRTSVIAESYRLRIRQWLRKVFWSAYGLLNGLAVHTSRYLGFYEQVRPIARRVHRWFLGKPV